MASWLVLSLIALVLFGLFSFFAKLSLKYLDWKTALLLQWSGIMTILIATWFLFKPNISFNIGSFYAFLAGLIGSISGIVFYQALAQGKASIVIPLTSLSTVVTLILIFIFLREKITLVQSIGITLAITSIALISISVK